MQRQLSNTNKKRELQKRSPNQTTHVSGKLSHKPGANIQKIFEIKSKSGDVAQKKQEISNHLLMESEKILSQCDSRIKTAHSTITVVYTILGIIVICLGLSSVLNYTMLKERADFFIAQIKSQGESAITEFKAKGNFAISEEKMAIASNVAESLKTGQDISQETLASAKSTIMLASNRDTLESAAVVLESNDEYYSSYLIWSMILDEKWDDDVALIAIYNAIFAIDNKEMPKNKKQQLALDAVYLSQKLVNKDSNNMSFMKAYMLSQKEMLNLESNPAIRMNIQKNTERFIFEKFVSLENFIDYFCLYIETITSIGYTKSIQEKENVFYTAESSLLKFMKLYQDNEKLISSYIQLKVAMLPLLKTVQEKRELLERLNDLRRGMDKSLNSRDAIELKVKLAEYTTDPEKRADLLHEAEALASEALRSSSEDKISYPLDSLKWSINYVDIKKKMVDYAATPQERRVLLREAEDQLVEDVHRFPNEALMFYRYVELKEKMLEYAATPQERSTLLREAEGLLVEALRRSSDDAVALIGGAALKAELADYAATPQKRDTLLREAENLLAEAARRLPDDVDAFLVGAGIKTKLADAAVIHQARDALLHEAESLLTEAARRYPDDVAVLSVGALIKTKLAEYAATPQKRDILLREAEGLLGEAVRRSPDNVGVLFGGIGLKARLAEHAATPQERDVLLREAKELLKQIPLRNPRMLLKVARLEVELAKYAVPQERKTLLGNAEMHIKQSGQENFPQLYYVKSCIAALRGQQERALELLEECRKAGTLPPREHLETDKALASLRDLDAFREFLKRAYPDETKDSE